MLRRQDFNLLFLLLFLCVSVCVALFSCENLFAEERPWVLAVEGKTVGEVPTRTQGRLTMVSIGTMGRLLNLSMTHKDDTLIVSQGRSKLQIVHKAAAVWLDVQLMPMAAPAILDNNQWWVESQSALNILQGLLQNSGSSSQLSWCGSSLDGRPSSRQGERGNADMSSSSTSASITSQQLQRGAQTQVEEVPSPPMIDLSPSAPCVLQAVRWGQYDEKTRVVFDYEGTVPPEILEKGNTVFVSFTTSEVATAQLVSPFPKEITVNVETAKDSCKISLGSQMGGSQKTFALSAPPRLVVDFYRSSKKASSPVNERPQAQDKPQKVIAEQRPLPPITGEKAGSLGKKLVVIDPGHGGKDPGAMANGLREKDLNLQFALCLAERIKKLGFNVRLTREDDVYLKLRERTDLANQWQADMFISVHANALPKGRHASGTEIYIMALPTDKDAMELALIENRELTGENGSESVAQVDQKTKMLLNILGNMQQNAKISESTDVAEYLFNAGKKQGLNMRRVAQAPFFVLRGASMPAVLIETGFLTEKSEAKRLASSSFQQQFADAIARGVAAYLKGR